MVAVGVSTYPAMYTWLPKMSAHLPPPFPSSPMPGLPSFASSPLEVILGSCCGLKTPPPDPWRANEMLTTYHLAIS